MKSRFWVLVLLFCVACDSQSCGIVDTTNHVLKTDTDGDGDDPFPKGQCTWRISCPEDEAVMFTSLSGKRPGVGWFTLKVYEVVLGYRMINRGAPFQNAFFEENLSYYSSEVDLDYKNMNDDAQTQTGGITLFYRCVKKCNSPLGLTIDTTNRRGTFQSKWSTVGEPEVCVYQIPPPPCYHYEMISFSMTRVPMYPITGDVHPGWMVQLGGMPNPGIFPNDYIAYELFRGAAGTFLIVRSKADIDIDFRIDYYCTPVANCSTKKLLQFPYAAILSDEDGQGPIPYGPSSLNCVYNVECPYDTNVFWRVIAGSLNAGIDSIGGKPIIGQQGGRSFAVFNDTDLYWVASKQQVTFKTTVNAGDWPGFTLKYECTPQCALDSPQSLPLPALYGVFSYNWTALSPSSDMCRWEVIPQCKVLNAIELNIVQNIPSWTSKIKLVFDHVYNEYDYVFPNTSLSNTIYYPADPFNLSVRAMPKEYVTYAVEYRCLNMTQCGDSILGTNYWTNGVMLSDSDGHGPRPYASDSGAQEIGCTRQFSCLGNATQIKITTLIGSLNSGDSLIIEAGVQSITKQDVFDSVLTLDSTSMEVSFNIRVSATGGKGFTLKFECDYGPTESQGSTTALEPTTAEPTTAEPTTAPTTCTVQANCSNHASRVVLDSETGECICTCRNQWSSPTDGVPNDQCSICPIQYNATDDCGSCHLPRKGYPTCNFTAYVYFNWTARCGNVTTKTMTVHQRFLALQQLSSLIQEFIYEGYGMDCLTENAVVFSWIMLAMQDDGVMQSEFIISSVGEHDYYEFGECLRRTLINLNTTLVTDYINEELKGECVAEPSASLVVNASICGEFGCPAAIDAGPSEDSGSALLIIIIIVAVLLLLLCCAIAYWYWRRIRLTAGDKEDPFFNSPGKYTKGFNIQGDEELLKLGAQRAANDMNDIQAIEEEMGLGGYNAPIAPPVGAAPAATGAQHTVMLEDI